MEEDPSSLAPALSIGAISAITGVSCFDDDDEEGTDNQLEINIHECEERKVDGGPTDVSEYVDELKTEATSLFSGPSSPAPGDAFSSPVVGQRAQSEPLQAGVPETQEGDRRKESEVSSQKRRQKMRRRKRTKKREVVKSKLKDISYDAVASSAAQRLTTSLAPYSTSRVPRKVS